MSNWKIKVFSKCWQQIKIISSKNYLRSTMRPQIPPHLWSSRDRNSFPDIHCKRYYCDSNRYYYNGNQLNAPLHVVHDMGGRRFYINFHEMGKAFIRYETDGRKIILKHTFVPDELRGYNIAQHLAEAAFAYVKENNLIADIKCSYLKKYAQKHNIANIK